MKPGDKSSECRRWFLFLALCVVCPLGVGSGSIPCPAEACCGVQQAGSCGSVFPCGYVGPGGLCAGPKLARCQWNRHRAPQMAELGALPFSGSSDTQEEAVTEKYRGAFSKCAGPVGAGTCFALKPNLELSWS